MELVIQYLPSDFGEWVQALLALCGGAAAITALTPTPKDDAALAKVRSLLDFLAFNWNHAKNGGKGTGV